MVAPQVGCDVCGCARHFGLRLHRRWKHWIPCLFSSCIRKFANDCHYNKCIPSVTLGSDISLHFNTAERYEKSNILKRWSDLCVWTCHTWLITECVPVESAPLQSQTIAYSVTTVSERPVGISSVLVQCGRVRSLNNIRVTFSVEHRTSCRGHV